MFGFNSLPRLAPLLGILLLMGCGAAALGRESEAPEPAVSNNQLGREHAIERALEELGQPWPEVTAVNNPRNPEARLMTLGEYEGEFMDGPSARDGTIPVWVVQVEGASRDDGIVPSESRQGYGYAVIALDARTGEVFGTRHSSDPVFAENPDSATQRTPEPTSAPAATAEEWSAGAIDYAAAIDPDMDMAEAERRANLLEEVRPTLASIRQQAQETPDTLAGLYIEHKPDLRVYLRLTADPSPALRAVIDESPVPIFVSTDAIASLSESQRRLDRAYPGLQAAVPELMGTWIEERTGDVVMDVFIQGSPEEVAAAKSRVEEAAASLGRETGLPVRIEYLPGPVTNGAGSADGGSEESSNGPVLALFPYSPAGLGARLSGELVVEGPCLYLVDGFDVRWLPVFPDKGVSWERGALILRGERFEIGDMVSVGGGGGAMDISHLQFVQEPDPSCDTQNVWLVYLGI